MKKYLVLILALLFVFSGCSAEPAPKDDPAEEYEETYFGEYEETYSGEITDIFTEGSGEDLVNVIEVLTENGEKIHFTVTEESEIIRYLEDVGERVPMTLDEIEIGSKVEVSCKSYENAGYHPIIEIKIIQKKLR